MTGKLEFIALRLSVCTLLTMQVAGGPRMCQLLGVQACAEPLHAEHGITTPGQGWVTL
jgi:hypothetical protein